jgi:hypothetical protein
MIFLSNLLCCHFVGHVLLPLLPGLEEEVDGAGDHEQEAVGDDVAA